MPISPARSLIAKEAGILTIVGLGLIRAFCLDLCCTRFLLGRFPLPRLAAAGGAKPSVLISGALVSNSSGLTVRLSLPFCCLGRRGFSSCLRGALPDRSSFFSAGATVAFACGWLCSWGRAFTGAAFAGGSCFVSETGLGWALGFSTLGSAAGGSTFFLLAGFFSAS